jgi:cysteine dioxygenase
MHATGNQRVEQISPERILGWSLPQGPLDAAALSDLARRLAEIPIDLELFSPWISFGSDCYQRVTLFASNQWEMVLTCWQPGQQSAIHNHGGSCGVSLVLAGHLTEALFEPCSPGTALAPQQRCIREVGPGEVLIETCQTVHRVENRSAAEALGLHFYSPPIVQMLPAEKPST